MNCGKCESCQLEEWGHGKVALLCMDDAALMFKGRIVNIVKKGYETKLRTEAPAWCPRRTNEQANV